MPYAMAKVEFADFSAGASPAGAVKGIASNGLRTPAPSAAPTPDMVEPVH